MTGNRFLSWPLLLTTVPILMATCCSFLFFYGEEIGVGAKPIVVLFWLSLFILTVEFFLIRQNRLMVSAMLALSLVLLIPAAPAVVVWSTWWFSGFAP